jgi:TRAP transporter 4TM/12TM fusion protein
MVHKRRLLSIKRIVVVVAILAGFYHLISTQYLLEGTLELKNTHLVFVLILVFLGMYERKRKLWPVMVLLISASIACTMYIKIFGPEMEWRAGFPTLADYVIGWLLIVLVLEACRQAYGLTLPIVSILAILYFFFGKYIPGPLRAAEILPGEITSFLATSYSGTGVYGTLLGISAQYIFLFVLFGGIIEGVGAGLFFREVARLIARRLAGGAALGAVISSGLVGMVTGAPAANVAITGVYTIPAMKASGVKPHQSGGFEACASTGGAIMPPVMGGTAFLMAGMLGIPYAKVCLLAAIPAALYFFTCGLQAQLVGMKLHLARPEEKANFRELAIRAPSFVLPLLTIIVILTLGYTAMFASFWAIVSVVITSVILKETRPSLGDFVQGWVRGATRGAEIGAACATIGILVTTMTVTGIGIKLPVAVEAWSGGIQVIALIITAFACLVLGCGLPGPAVYVLVALVTAPVLVAMGTDAPIAHLFVLFYGIAAAISPPVGIASLTAAGIAGSPYLKTAFEGVKIGIALFIVPFLFVYNPALTLGPMKLVPGVLSLLATVLGLVVLSVTLRAQYLTRVNLFELTISFLAAIGLFAFVIVQTYIFLAIGLILFAILTTLQWRKRGKEK